MKPRTIFIITPIGEKGSKKCKKYSAIFRSIIQPAAQSVDSGFNIIRSDHIGRPGSFTKDILENLRDAYIVIANLTELNPNVFYELGIRHTLNNRTIMMTEDLSSIPSDLKEYRAIEYRADLNGAAGTKQILAKCIEEIMDDPDRPDNPVQDRLFIFKKKENVFLSSAEEVQKVSGGRFFIGVDIGAEKIDFSLLDYSRFEDQISHRDKITIWKESTKTPDHISDICETTANTIERLALWAQRHDVKPIHGIGLGLPGLVEPRSGIFIQSPSLGLHDHYPVVDVLNDAIQWGKIKALIPRALSKIPILIDNDVRCATRYTWMSSPGLKNLVCIFIGNGLGSGIVLNGKMIYGKHFFAGEAGHTTISSAGEFLNPPLRCHCGRKGSHWEMHVCSYGMKHMMMSTRPEMFRKFKAKYLKGRELSTYVIRKAYEKKDKYAQKIVKKFFEYVAVGVANYINMLNPEQIVLGGGMIRAFCPGEEGHKMLWDKISKYALPTSVGPELIIDATSKLYLASLGAALIFKDASYLEYLGRKEESLRKTIGC